MRGCGSWNASIVLALSAITFGAAGTARGDELRDDASRQLSRGQSLGSLPLYFEANAGQTDPEVEFLSRGPRHTIFFSRSKAVLVLPSRARKPGAGRRTVVGIRFVGANPRPEVSGTDVLAGKVNYFVGNDPAKWRTDVATYGKVVYRELYPGIDLVFYGRDGQLEYDLVARPGADLRRIVLGFDGVERLQVDAQGDLLMRTKAGVVHQRRPVVYQPTEGGRREISGGYVLEGPRRVAFKVAPHDRTRAVVIDPVLLYSGYLGGSGSDAAGGIAVDAGRNAYVTGGTDSVDFPVTAAAARRVHGGFDDCFVTKLNATGSALVYSTYLGGSGDEGCAAIAVDAGGNAYVAGSTSSTDFPTTAGAVQTALALTGTGGGDVFMAKLDALGGTRLYTK